LRFKNETNYLKKMGFQLWRINATEENRKNRIETERDFNHISETDLDDYKEFDIIIENNDSLKEFEQKIIDIIEPSQIPLKKLTPEK
jgi:dephospho-CoA kinase